MQSVHELLAGENHKSVQLVSLVCVLGVLGFLLLASVVINFFDQSLSWTQTAFALCSLWLLFVGCTSFYQQEAGKQYVVYVLGRDYVDTFVSFGFSETQNPHNGLKMKDPPYNGKVSLLWLFALWPLYKVIELPTTPITLKHDDIQIHTKEGTPFITEATIEVSLSACARHLLEHIGLLGGGSDLTLHGCFALTETLKSILQPSLHEAFGAIATQFSLLGPIGILANVNEFKARVKLFLAENFDSSWYFTRLLQIREDNSGKKTVCPGLSAISLRLNLRIKVSDVALFKALNQPEIARLEAEGIQVLSEKTGVPSEVIMSLRTIEGVSGTKYFFFD